MKEPIIGRPEPRTIVFSRERQEEMCDFYLIDTFGCIPTNIGTKRATATIDDETIWINLDIQYLTEADFILIDSVLTVASDA